MSESTFLFKTINEFMKALFEKEEVYLTKQETHLINKNIEAGGTPDGFRYLGLIYSQLEGAARPRGNYGLLQPSLVPEMDALALERKTMIEDKKAIRQALFLVLKDCQSAQDMRDALPNSVKEMIPGCSRLERTRAEAFTIADNPRSFTQYMKLRDRIDFYAVSRLLY